MPFPCVSSDNGWDCVYRGFSCLQDKFLTPCCVDEKVKIYLCDLVLRLACYFRADMVDENPYSLCAASRLYLCRDSTLCTDYDLYYCPVRIAAREIKKPSYHLFIVFLCCLHRSEQYFTSSQTFSHFLRHENGRAQTTHIFWGRSDFLITSNLI